MASLLFPSLASSSSFPDLGRRRRNRLSVSLCAVFARSEEEDLCKFPTKVVISYKKQFSIIYYVFCPKCRGVLIQHLCHSLLLGCLLLPT